MKAAALAVLLLLSCAAPPKPSAVAEPPTPVDPEAPDRAACERLCARERACGADVQACASTCEADRRRMKPGFVAAYVHCYAPLVACGAADEKAREQLHASCFDAALTGFGRDDHNQRAMAEAVCNRGERCLGLGPVGRDACLQATLDPKEPEVKLGQRLVDALRRERVVAFRTCVDASPCAGLGEADGAVDACYAKTIGGGA